MLSKPVRWRRMAIAAMAAVSLALTALAAQVSPPNTGAATAESATARDGEKKPGERVAIKLPAEALERHVGTYKLNDQTFFDVKHDDGKLMIRITGQPIFEVFPERENFFFWKVVDAQIEFATDGTGGATLYQWGKEFPLTAVDPGSAALAQAALDARVASQAATPGSEAALRRYLDGVAASNIDYAQMDSLLADVTRKQETQIYALTSQLGPLQGIKFVGVGNQGWDVYDVKFANGNLQYRIAMGSDGRIHGLMAMTVP